MPKIKIQTGLRLDEDLYEKVKALAEREGRSINNLAEYIIRRYVQECEERSGSLVPSQQQ
ncbi:MAG: ribbon-helix-helix protein, CopG family [Oscillospiraceae bacterium]|nr:ribbon-helix-helix protein, CopG family [Oscillospiraceae bacterium]